VSAAFRPPADCPAHAGAHVRVHGNHLRIDGKPTFLLGGEVQYFRVRDAGFDGAATRRLWEARLDQLKAAGCNLVTTYVPWDYHAPEAGKYDWTGARDLPAFLEIAAEKGFHLTVKPGPHILAEWPYGFGSWGAIPLWWREANKDELVRERSGKVFRWHPVLPEIGPSYNVLPSYASERFRAATEGWIEEVHGRIRHLMGPGKPVVLLQLDNETNLFWSDIYRIDFNPMALALFRARLHMRYEGRLGAISEAYGRRVASFEEVEPPLRGKGPKAAHDDWFDHQHALVGAWLAACRAMWARLGVNEPDVLFQTNDTHQTFPVRDLVLPNGLVKNRAGLHGLDTYPRCLPIPRSARILADRPFEADWTTKLIDVYNDLYLGPSRFTLGAEIQGGHFAIHLPFGQQAVPHKITAASTLHTWLRVVAQGMKAVGIYVLVGGLNIDGTAYDFQAAVRHDGSTHPRYEGLKALGALVKRHEAELLESEAVESRIGIVADARALGAGYGHDGEQRIYGDELRACYGWLAHAGFEARALDLGLARDRELDACKALIFPTSGRIPEEDAAKLERYVERGGTLVQAIAPGPLARSLFPHVAGEVSWTTRLLGAAMARFTVSGAAGGLAVNRSGPPRLRAPKDASAVLAFPDEAPHVLGYARPPNENGGRAVFLSTLPTTPFASAELYSVPPHVLEAHALFARRLLKLAEEVRLVACEGVREEVHVRRVPSSGALLLFCFSSHEEADMGVRLRALEALGLDPAARYAVEDIFETDSQGAPRLLREGTGAALREEGVRIPLAPLGATVLRVRALAASAPAQASVPLDPPATMSRL